MGSKNKGLMLLLFMLIGCGDDPTADLTNSNTQSSTINESSTDSSSATEAEDSIEIEEEEATSEINEVLSIPDEIQEWFSLASEEYVVYGGGLEGGITNLIVEYSIDENLKYMNVARGLCDRSGSTPRIVLFQYDWVPMRTRDMTRNDNQQKRSFYNLLGQCVFNLPFNDETTRVTYGGVEYDYPDSIMHSNWYGGMVPGDVRDYWVENCITKMWREIKQ